MESPGKEALVTLMALLWDRPGTSLNVNSANLWNSGEKDCSTFSYQETVTLSFIFGLQRATIRFGVDI